jgi:hypothetical protein
VVLTDLGLNQAPREGDLVQGQCGMKSIIARPVLNLMIKIRVNHFIPLRAKRVGEFIEIRHKKISLTPMLSTLECL